MAYIFDNIVQWTGDPDHRWVVKLKPQPAGLHIMSSFARRINFLLHWIWCSRCMPNRCHWIEAPSDSLQCDVVGSSRPAEVFATLLGTYNYLILALLRIGASEWAEHLWHRVGAAQLKLRHIICIVVLSPQAMADKVFVKVRPNQIDLHSMSGPVARFLGLAGWDPMGCEMLWGGCLGFLQVFFLIKAFQISKHMDFVEEKSDLQWG